jgi:hypothetical protein
MEEFIDPDQSCAPRREKEAKPLERQFLTLRNQARMIPSPDTANRLRPCALTSAKPKATHAALDAFRDESAPVPGILTKP